MTKHLYIHIPFCNQICSFCDFQRIKSSNSQIMDEYVNKIITQVKLTSSLKQYKTIYLGGGTPNHLPNKILNKLLSFLSNYLVSNNYEFTIECNPDLITQEQVKIFCKNKVNRISLGVQSTNNIILKQMHRTHTIEDVETAIQILKKNNINNISCDFIYDLPNTTLNDITNYVDFVKKHDLNHVSFYALEIKPNAILKKQNYQQDLVDQEDKMFFLQTLLAKNNYQRYEVSNWSKTEKEQSQHNLAYWKSKDWKAIGFGAHGFENQTTYAIGGSVQNFYVNSLNTLDKKEYYFQILMMGLRLTKGLNLNNDIYLQAYLFYKDKLKNCQIINNHLVANNIDLLDDILLELI